MVAIAGLFLAAGCGGERADEDEPSGDFPVEIVSATFPEQQKLAQTSDLVITVRNAGEATIPNLGVTVEGFDYRKDDDRSLADSARPVFASNGVPVQIGGFPEAKDASPRGCDSAYVGLWACGPVRPGREKTFRWSVTAVKAGDYELRWQIAAGLYGGARAVLAGSDERPSGSFSGTISRRAPQARIGQDGKTVVIE